MNSIVNILSSGQITTSSTIGCGGIQVTDIGGISTYNNATATKTSSTSLTGDIACKSVSTTGSTGLAIGTNLVTNASISQTGGSSM